MKIEIREATAEDHAWLKRLIVKSSVYGVPYGRDIPNQVVKAKARQGAQEVIARSVSDPNFQALIAFDVESGDRLGYYFLDYSHIEPSTGEPQSHIFDMGVEEDYWGSQTGPSMVKDAAKRTGRAGLRYMRAEISADNRRSLLKAMRMGFELERYQLVMACTPEGRAKMPGRSDSQKAHLVSRRKRGKKD